MKGLVFVIIATLAAVSNGIGEEHVASGVITAVDSGAKTVTVKTRDGVEYTAKVTADTTLTGAAEAKGGAIAAAKTTALGAKKGSQAVVHYSGEGANKTAHGVKILSDSSVKLASGAVTAVDHHAGTVAVKATDGTESTYHVASDGVVEAGTTTKVNAQASAKATAHGVTTGTQVTLHYTDEGGKRVVHGIQHVF